MNNKNIQQLDSFIKLFKIFPKEFRSSLYEQYELKDYIKHGFVFIDKNFRILNSVPREVFASAKKYYSKLQNAKEFNNTFYKSFSDVRDLPIETLVIDQIKHYLSTYGAESIGIEMPQYIPASKLDLDDLLSDGHNDNFKFIFIKMLPFADCVNCINSCLAKVTSPSPSFIEDIKSLLEIDCIDIDSIKSFEIKMLKYDIEDLVPSNPIDVLRYLIFKTTGETLIIKNEYLINKIKYNSHIQDAYKILSKASEESLASIFFRYKPIFLAYKCYDKCGPIINRIRRKADKFHKPLKQESVQNFLCVNDLNKQLKIINNASNRELIKILNAIRARVLTNNNAPAIYTIRNGKAFVDINGFKNSLSLIEYQNIYNLILSVLKIRLHPLAGKAFYIPSYIRYAAPTTEKQFIGNIPYGSSLEIPKEKAFTLGIHWFDNESRVDLDLHLRSPSHHFGWNGNYSCYDEIIYTGDMTGAPRPFGAAEAFWFGAKDNEKYIASVNLYSGDENSEFKMFMTEEKPDLQDKRYTYNPANALFPAIPLKMSGNKEMTLGLIDSTRFYFYGNRISSDIVPNGNVEPFIHGLTMQFYSKISINELLELAEAKVYDENELDGKVEKDIISLSPENLSINTLLNIVDGVED